MSRALTDRDTAVAIETSTVPRYTATAQVLHWLTSALVVAVLPLAWVATSLAPSPTKGNVFVFHKSVGLTILALVAIRLLWRAVHHAPPEVTEPTGLAIIAKASHWLLYLIFLVMPISGFLLSAFHGNATPYFWLFTIPALERNDGLAQVFDSVHLAGQWAVYVLVLLHILATVWHVAIRRDYVLDRMLPPQNPDRLRGR